MDAILVELIYVLQLFQRSITSSVADCVANAEMVLYL